MNKGFLGCLGVLAVVALIAVIFGGWVIGQQNDLARSQESVNSAWSQVQNVYQRRFDLIPNLVETVKGAASFERETYTAVAEARSKVGQIRITPEMLNDPQTFKRFDQAQGELSGALSRLMAVAENYPQLKANQNFLDLQSQLEGTENRIAVERRNFNQVAQAYNTKIRMIPTNFVAGLFHFTARPYFEAAEGAEKAPAVNFGGSGSPPK